MRWIPCLLGALLLTGCGSSSSQPGATAEAHLTEKPGVLPPDKTALRVAQQFAPAGVSNQVRLMLLHQALHARNRNPGFVWKVEPWGTSYKVQAVLSAAQRHDTTFEWKVDFAKPPHLVCEPANEEARMLGKIHIKLDESGLEDWLGPRLTPAEPGTPRP